jgi:rhodanese-related sulfurtransferase
MNRFMPSVVAASVIAILFSTIVLAAETTKESLKAVKEKIDKKNAVLVDVREKSEWEKGHVEGAIFLPLSELKAGIDDKSLTAKLPKDKALYTHCVVGKRSLTACEMLEKRGYKVLSLKPGYKELIAAGFTPAEQK